MNNSLFCLLISTLFLLTTCQKNNSGITGGEWLLPADEVLSGGPGKDGIPSINNPQFIEQGEITNIADDELVVAVKIENETRLYPHEILDWHEIVNDRIENTYFALTYCPLTGTALNWNRNLGGTITTFGVSGLLYNSNLMPFDRETNSTWSQLDLRCVNGRLIGEQAEILPHWETEWATAKKLFPNARVLSRNTGFTRRYGQYPYGDYRSSTTTLFPVDETDDQIFSKERVMGIIDNGNAQVYQFELFKEDQIDIIIDNTGDEKYVVIGNRNNNFMTAYLRTLTDGTTLEFSIENPANEVNDFRMIDQEGTVWNVLGEAIAGPRTGTQLKQPNAFMGFWFSFVAFYNEVTVYQK